MSNRRHRAPSVLDRPLRALGREDPLAILSLLRIAAPDLVPPLAPVTPGEVDDPTLELGLVEGIADLVIRVGSLIVHVEFQGYRDPTFGRRLLFYQAALIKRYPKCRVLSVALWTIQPPSGESRNEIRVQSVMMKVTSLVLPELSAEILLEDVSTACFAVGAAAGTLSIEVLCRRVVSMMVQGQAGEGAWRVARVVAAAAGRYKVFCEAMEQARVKAPLTDDLVRYGIDVGYRRGRRRGRQQGRSEGLQQALLATYAARFGEVPADIAAVVEATHEPETLLEWQAVFSTRTARAIAAAVRAAAPPG